MTIRLFNRQRREPDVVAAYVQPGVRLHEQRVVQEPFYILDKAGLPMNSCSHVTEFSPIFELNGFNTYLDQ